MGYLRGLYASFLWDTAELVCAGYGWDVAADLVLAQTVPLTGLTVLAAC